jgi:phosphoribosylglycinamide formyltransferase 1
MAERARDGRYRGCTSLQSPRSNPPESGSNHWGDLLSARIVVLVSGAGTNLAALLEAAKDPEYGATVVAVGADRDGIEGLARAERAGVPTFVVKLADFGSRDDWDAALTEAVAAYQPTLVVSAGFMKIFGKRFIEAFTTLNTHPALLPSFPGAHAVQDALAYGVKVTGATVHVVDDGVDTGPVVAQVAVAVADDDDEESLHERIKVAERDLLVNVVRRWSHGHFYYGRKVTTR